MHMQLVNHTIPDDVLKIVLRGISNYFDPITIDERRVYTKKGSSDKIRWNLNANDGENREYLKVIAHPRDHVPSNPISLRYINYIYSSLMPVIIFFKYKDRSRYLTN